jgi:hypothetical protein
MNGKRMEQGRKRQSLFLRLHFLPTGKFLTDALFGFVHAAHMSCVRRSCCMTIFVVVGLGRGLAGEAVLHGKIRDSATGELTACSVSITDANGKVVLENDSFKGGFRCSGEFTRHLPSGPTRIRITRGFETRAIEQDVTLAPGETRELDYELERIVDLRKRGWFGGDNHVHMLHGERTVPVEFDFVALTARAEDLQFMSLAQAWNIDVPTPERLGRELSRRSSPDCFLTWNLEAPKNYYKGDAGRCLGHCWNVGMRGRTREGSDVIRVLMDASAWDYESSKPSFANFESHELIHEQGGAVSYTHPARWWMGSWGGQGGYPKVERMRVSNMAVELPLDTLLGPTYDGIDVVTGPAEFEANAKAFELWSMLLNHGYRLAATGSSDSCFDRPGGGVPGTPRTYVSITGKFSFSKAAKAIAAGNTFVTTGPLLIAAIESKPPGSAFSAGDAPRLLSIEAWASGRDGGGLERIEVLRNGRSWREFTLNERPEGIRTNVSVIERESAWYCVRVFGSGKRTAVTSAFYFTGASYRPPNPVRARVRVKVVDAESGASLDSVVREITLAGCIPRVGARHQVRNGGAEMIVPGKVRLRAEAKGYTPVTLSPFLDDPELVKIVAELTENDLLQWETFERIANQLEKIDLVFKLRKATPK